MMLAVRPDLFPEIKGTTDSEVMFHLALTFGLEDDPIGALERMAGFVESLGAAAGIEEPLQMTVGASDGQRLIAARYASGAVVNTLFHSTDVEGLRLLYPTDKRLAGFSADARAVVSEPLTALPRHVAGGARRVRDRRGARPRRTAPVPTAPALDGGHDPLQATTAVAAPPSAPIAPLSRPNGRVKLTTPSLCAARECSRRRTGRGSPTFRPEDVVGGVVHRH